MKYLLSYIGTFLFSFCLFATEEKRTDTLDLMHRSGKIYVVVTVVLIILTGIIFYLILLDRKIKRLENREK